MLVEKIFFRILTIKTLLHHFHMTAVAGSPPQIPPCASHRFFYVITQSKQAGKWKDCCLPFLGEVELRQSRQSRLVPSVQCSSSSFFMPGRQKKGGPQRNMKAEKTRELQENLSSNLCLTLNQFSDAFSNLINNEKWSSFRCHPEPISYGSTTTKGSNFFPRHSAINRPNCARAKLFMIFRELRLKATSRSPPSMSAVLLSYTVL